MKNFVCLMMLLLFVIGCSSYDDGSEPTGGRIPLYSPFRFSFSGESSDIYKISIQTLDKIKPKPMFHEDYDGKEVVTQGAYKVTRRMTEPNDYIELGFNPMYADKKRLLEIKIYKNNHLLKAVTIGYTARAFDSLYESVRGRAEKGDVLSLSQAAWDTYPRVRIVNGSGESVAGSKNVYIKADGVTVVIISYE